MIKLKNSNRYLVPGIIESCFSKGKVTHVDKQICGNGFSTAFLELSPKKNKKNIIIAPNKAVVIAKESEYIKGKLKGLNRMKFFYAESQEVNLHDAEVLVFVADSFLAMETKLKEISDRIDKVLIDEFHSVEIQSLFRSPLVDFENKVKAIFTNVATSIVTVTASPNLFSKVDVLITNEGIKPSTINVSKDRSETIKRIKSDIKNNRPAVVCTNSATAIYKLFYDKNKKKPIKANFITGVSLTRSLSELIEISPDVDSNLTIVSSRGFEGFDIHYKEANVYFLEDRANDFERFFIANLYQALNRVRSGAKYIEYNRLELSNRRSEPFINIEKAVERFIATRSISNNSKQKTKYKKYKPFIIFEPINKGLFSIKKNVGAINLYKETLIFDKPFPSKEFEQFLTDRKITINHLSEINNRLKKKVRISTKEEMLLKNKAFIESVNLFGSDYKLRVLDINKDHETHDNRVLYLKHLKEYLRRKNYAQDRIPSDREIVALSLLKEPKKYTNLIQKVTKEFDSRSIKKYGVKNSLKYRTEFRNKVFNIVCKWILAFANNRINIPKKWIANRNYNISVEIGVSEIEIIANEFNVTTKEIDISSCFPRVLYALNGMSLPDNFYGTNKKNKLSINVAINDFFYDKKSQTTKSMQRWNSIRKFKNLGFADKVINYLMDHFFEADFKGDLFNFLAFHEKNLISNVKALFKNLDNDGVIRRHDSVIVFNNKTDATFLNEIEYLDVKSWFDVKEIPVIDIKERLTKEESDQEFDQFIRDKEILDRIRNHPNESTRYMAL